MYLFSQVMFEPLRELSVLSAYLLLPTYSSFSVQRISLKIIVDN